MILKFIEFINEQKKLLNELTDSSKQKISFNIDWNDNIGKVNTDIILAMSDTSLGMYSLGPDVEKYTGLPEKDAKEYKETPLDAFVYGMCNTVNNGKDLFFWTNGTRLKGASTKVGIWPAIFEQLSHECVHLTRLILVKHILTNQKSKDWVSDPWPSIGDDPEKNLIDEEAFATSLGIVVQTLTKPFLKLASKYIPEIEDLIISESIITIEEKVLEFAKNFYKQLNEGKHLYINTLPKITNIDKAKYTIMEIFEKEKISIYGFKVYEETTEDFLKKIASKNNNYICIGKVNGTYTYVMEY